MIYWQYLLPHYKINKLAKLISNCSIGWVKNLLIHSFLKRYKVNLEEALNSDPYSYKNYNDFFIRKLDPKARIIDLNPNNIISPCDGYITEYGNIEQDLRIKAKEKRLDLSNLLANNCSADQGLININDFINGKFINIYLAPHNYHRVHMPINATLKGMKYIPGKLFSVSPKSVNKIPDVYTMNERIISLFESDLGKVIVILIGAMIVGSVVTSWHGEVTPAKNKTIQFWNFEDKQLTLARAEELGYFQLGSTVIVLFENKNLNFTSNVQYNTSIKMGEKILKII